MRRSLGERECNKLMYSDCRGRLHSISCKMPRKSCKSHVFFLTETSNAENKATVYLIFTDMPGHHLISSRYLRLKYVWFSSDWHPYPPLPFKHFKGFPSSAICPSRVRHGGHFYHSNSMRVLFSWTQLGPEHEIDLRGAPYELGTYAKVCVCKICSLTKFKVDLRTLTLKYLSAVF